MSPTTDLADLLDAIPTVATNLDETTIAVLHQVLVNTVGPSTAGEILGAFDTALSEIRTGAGSGDPEFDAEVAAGRERMRAVLAELATTTGLRWRNWGGRSYVVTLDGQHIGYVAPARVSGGSHNTRSRVQDWRPSLCLSLSSTAMERTRTVELAARAVEQAHRARDTEPTR